MGGLCRRERNHSCFAGSDIEPHSHDSDNWGVITKGEMIITMNGSEMTYGTGDWYHVPAGCRHAAKCFVETEEIEFWFDSQGR